LLAVMAEAYAAARRELGEPAEPACRAARGPTVLAADPSARILVAEDDAIGVEVVTHLLGRMGLDHDVVANGREAVEAVRKGGYALVLMDGHMPEMDGFEATRVIREYERESRPQPPRIPIVALTANALKGDRERCLEAGMDDYLTKPIDSQRLTETMARFLARRSGAPSGEDEKTPSETSVNNAPPATPAVAAARAPRDLDLEGVIKRWGGDKAFVAPLVRKFCERTPGDLALLKQRVEAAEAPSVKELAHRLKGAASYVGAESFRGIVATLEAEAGQGDLRDAPTHLNDLRDALERCAAQARECGLIDSSTPLEPHAAEVDCG